MSTIEQWLGRLKKAKNPKVTILTHDDPDPDALASALAAAEIVKFCGGEPLICYGGQLAHVQTRIFFNRLDLQSKSIRVTGITDESELAALYKQIKKNRIIIVDTSCYPGKGNMLSYGDMIAENDVNVMIDHHIASQVELPNTYHYEKFGSCSAIMYKLLRKLEVPIDRNLATALAIGIEIDTDMLRSESATEDDKIACDELKDIFDPKSYMAIMNYPQPRKLMDLKRQAYSSFIHDGDVIVAGVGFVKSTHKSLIATIADEFMNYDAVSHSLIIGIIDDGFGETKKLVVSLRNSGDVIDTDELIRSVFGSGFGGRRGAGGGLVELDFTTSLLIDHMYENNNYSARSQKLFNEVFSAYAKRFMELKGRVS